jgi:hypothetical protein
MADVRINPSFPSWNLFDVRSIQEYEYSAHIEEIFNPSTEHEFKDSYFSNRPFDGSQYLCYGQFALMCISESIAIIRFGLSLRYQWPLDNEAEDMSCEVTQQESRGDLLVTEFRNEK